MSLRGSAWVCVGLRGSAWVCVVLRGAAWCCVVLRIAAWVCEVLRGDVCDMSDAYFIELLPAFTTKYLCATILSTTLKQQY